MRDAQYKNIGSEPWGTAGKKTKGCRVMYRALKKRMKNRLARWARRDKDAK